MQGRSAIWACSSDCSHFGPLGFDGGVEIEICGRLYGAILECLFESEESFSSHFIIPTIVTILPSNVEAFIKTSLQAILKTLSASELPRPFEYKLLLKASSCGPCSCSRLLCFVPIRSKSIDCLLGPGIFSIGKF